MLNEIEEAIQSRINSLFDLKNGRLCAVKLIALAFYYSTLARVLDPASHYVWRRVYSQVAAKYQAQQTEPSPEEIIRIDDEL